MIHLTPYEQRMLDGEFGAAKQVALQKIIDYAQILGATELVPITKAHLCCGSTCEPSDFPDGNLDRPDILAMGYHDWQTKLKCPGLDPAAFNSFNETTYVMDDVHCCDTFQWQWPQQTKEFYENNRQILSDAADRGVMIGSTCAPYLAGPAPAGEPPRHPRVPCGLRHQGQDGLGSAGRGGGPPSGAQRRPCYLRRL